MTVEQAIHHRSLGNHREALHVLLAIHEERPDDAGVAYQLGLTCMGMHNDRDAIRWFSRAVELRLPPHEDRDAVLGWTACLRGQRRYFEAAKVLVEGQKRHPDDPGLRVFHALVMHQMGMHREAVALLVNVLINTSDAERIQDLAPALAYYADQL